MELNGFTEEMLDMTLEELIEWSLKGGLAPIISFEDIKEEDQSTYSITVTSLNQ